MRFKQLQYTLRVTSTAVAVWAGVADAGCAGAVSGRIGADAGGDAAIRTNPTPVAVDASVVHSDASTRADASASQTPDASAGVPCEYEAASAGKRQLGIDMLDVNANEDFGVNVARAADLHVRYHTLHLAWTAIETTAGNAGSSGTLVDPDSALRTLTAFASEQHLGLSLTLRPIDATGKTVPSDLAGLNFNDPVFIARFEKLLDFVLSHFPSQRLVNVMIGNEVDNYDPRGDTDFWIEYAQFLAAIHTYATTKYPSVPIGFTATWDGLTDSTRKTRDGWPTQQVLQTFAKQVDVVGATYYALGADFMHRPPTSVSADLAALVAAVPDDKPIHIQEAGYASAPQTGSSEAAQARFYCELLHGWDLHAERILRLAALRLNDVTTNQAAQLAGPYGLSNPAFLEYLRTLGLRNANGVAKPAFTVFARGATQRGF
jgi:hypothetical protein